jgi:hypothetical protein
VGSRPARRASACSNRSESGIEVGWDEVECCTDLS